MDSRIGAGTVFWIELQREIEAQDEMPAPMVQAEPPPLSPSAFTLLYVEDNQINAQLVKAIYRRHPEVRLIVAANGSLGLEFAHAHRPDLILLDINLPGMDGYEVKRRLDADEATAGIPVVAISANAMPQDLEKGRAAGFADYLTKPIDIRRLEAAVDRVFASKKAMR